MPTPLGLKKSRRQLDWERNTRLCFANVDNPKGKDLVPDCYLPKCAMNIPDKEERQLITKMIIKACADSFHDWKVHESYYDKNAKSEYDSDSSGDMMYVPNSDVIPSNGSPPLLEKNNHQPVEDVGNFVMHSDDV